MERIERGRPPEEPASTQRIARGGHSARAASVSISMTTLLPTTTLPSSSEWLKLTPKSRRSMVALAEKATTVLPSCMDGPFPEELEVEVDRLGDATDGQVGREDPVGVVDLAQALADQGQRGVVGDVEEVVGAQVLVPLLLAGEDAGGLDGGLEGRVLGLLGHGEGAGTSVKRPRTLVPTRWRATKPTSVWAGSMA